MNLQLLFQMLIHEAQSAGIDVEKAQCVKFDSQNSTLQVKTAQKNFFIRLLAVEEIAVMKKKYPILSGPEAFRISSHVYSINEKDRESLTFECPSFGACTPREAKFIGEYIDVRFDTIKNLPLQRISFEGTAFTVTDKRPVKGYPCGSPFSGIKVYGEYDKQTRTGWMSPDMYSSMEIYLC